MKILLIVNSSASSVTARTRVVIQKALSADTSWSAAETSRRGHAARLAQGAAATGTDLVVVLGVDGICTNVPDVAVAVIRRPAPPDR